MVNYQSSPNVNLVRKENSKKNQRSLLLKENTPLDPKGVTWIYQLACQKPLFVDLTEDVLHHIRSK